MICRREFLAAASLGVLSTALPVRAWAQDDADARLYDLFRRLAETDTDESLAGVARRRAALGGRLAALKAFNSARLSPEARLDYDSVLQGMAVETELHSRFPFGALGPTAAPYVVTQRNGAYLTLDAAEPAQLVRTLDGENERIGADASLGVVPPDFIVQQTLAKLGDVRNAAVLNVKPGDVILALERQIATLTEISERAGHDGGVWRWRDGDDYYALALKAGATLPVSPDEAYRNGLEEVRNLSARADVLLKAQGLSKGGTGERLHALAQQPRYLYSDDDTGRAAALADLNAWLALVRPKLASAFRGLSGEAVSIKLAGPGQIGYRAAPSYDGSKPGAYYVDLRYIRRRPRWSLRTVVHHETQPGHLVQLPFQEHANPPPLRLRYTATAFTEGWAIYAEQLADEMGLFDGDPLGRIGYLQSLLVRLGRQIVDTGIHHQRWSREKAIATFADICGDAPEAFDTEVDRMVVQPGYTPGHALARTAILGLREKARHALGRKFESIGFHDAVLRRGALPMTVLESAVDRYIAERKHA